MHYISTALKRFIVFFIWYCVLNLGLEVPHALAACTALIVAYMRPVRKPEHEKKVAVAAYSGGHQPRPGVGTDNPPPGRP